MRRLVAMPRPGWVLLAVAFAAGSAPIARAQDGGFHPLDSALEMMNLKTEPGAMPDFVQQSRPSAAQQSYIPAGAKPATRALTMKTPAEVKALTAELDAARAAQLAGKRPASPSVQAGGPAKPGKPLALGRKARVATDR